MLDREIAPERVVAADLALDSGRDRRVLAGVLALGVKLLVASALLYWLISRGKLDLTVLQRVQHMGYLLGCVLLLLAGMVLPVLRWRWLINTQQLHLGFVATLRLTWLGYFAGIFMPGAGGGDLLKVYAICKRCPSAKTQAVSTIFVDRVMGLHSMLFASTLAAVGLLTYGCPRKVVLMAWFAIVIFSASSACIFLAVWKPTSGLAIRLLPRGFRQSLEISLQLYVSSSGQVALIWLFSVGCTLVTMSSYYFASAAVGESLGLIQTIAAIPLVVIANTIPFTPGGIGMGESVGSELLGLFGLMHGALIVLLVRLVGIVFSIPGVLVLFGKNSMSRGKNVPRNA